MIRWLKRWGAGLVSLVATISCMWTGDALGAGLSGLLAGASLVIALDDAIAEAEGCRRGSAE